MFLESGGGGVGRVQKEGLDTAMGGCNLQARRPRGERREEIRPWSGRRLDDLKLVADEWMDR